jgi:hypothetical protein
MCSCFVGFPSPQPTSRPSTGAPGEYRTEVEHMVGGSTSRLQTQRSEVAFPVAAATNVKPLSYRWGSYMLNVCYIAIGYLLYVHKDIILTAVL